MIRHPTCDTKIEEWVIFAVWNSQAPGNQTEEISGEFLAQYCDFWNHTNNEPSGRPSRTDATHALHAVVAVVLWPVVERR